MIITDSNGEQPLSAMVSMITKVREASSIRSHAEVGSNWFFPPPFSFPVLSPSFLSSPSFLTFPLSSFLFLSFPFPSHFLKFFSCSPFSFPSPAPTQQLNLGSVTE